jgi:hypothetical protein
MRRLVLVALLGSAAGLAHAQARTFAYEADLAQATKRSAVTAGGVAWSCADTRCVASGRGGNVSVGGCSQLARVVGPITRYRSEIKVLAEPGVRECNRIAQAAGDATAKAAKGAASPQRATTPEIVFTGVAADAAPAQPERKR